VQRILVLATTPQVIQLSDEDGEGKEVLGNEERSGENAPFPLDLQREESGGTKAAFELSFASVPQLRSDRGPGHGGQARKGGVADGWSSDDEEWGSGLGMRWQRPDRPAKARASKFEANRKRDSGSARVIITGVRLDWQAPMMHSILEVCLAHHLSVSKASQAMSSQGDSLSPDLRYASADGAGAGVGLNPETHCMGDHSFVARSSRPEEAGAVPNVSLEMHDAWLNLLVTKRAVMALDVPHAIMTLSSHELPHHPVQTRDKQGLEAVANLCAVEVRDFAVHRMHDYSWDAPFLPGKLTDISYEFDCESYPARPSPGQRSDHFLHVSTFRAAMPLSVLQHIAQSADSTESEGYPQAAQRAYIDVQQFTVNIPMPANISLHGRREGLRGRWSTQDHFMRDSLAHWTDLGVMAGDCLLVQKAMLVFIKERMKGATSSAANAAGEEGGSMTELPRGMPDIDLHLSAFEVKFMDDSFEVWMGAFHRLHLDEADQRRKRDILLNARLDELRLMPGVHVSAAQEAQMRYELQRQNSLAWVRRVAKFKCADFFQSPPPLLDLKMDSLTGLFMPRQAVWLERKVVKLDRSGVSFESAQWPEFNMLVGGQMTNVKASNISLHIRDYIEPLFTIAAVEVCCVGDQDDDDASSASRSARKSGSSAGGLGGTPSKDDRSDAEGGAREDATQLPGDWKRRGCLIMSEEKLPKAAHSLRVAVQQRLHPDAPAVCFTSSPAPTKLWAELDVLLREPKVSHGPSLGPATNIISMVVSGLSPPSSKNPGKQPPSIMSWDQARLQAHGNVRLHMDRACLRLRADPSPYSNAECFQLRGQPITIWYDACEPELSRNDHKNSGDQTPHHLGEAPALKVGRVHIESQMVEWTMLSSSKEMASCVLLNKPLFKAVRMNFTISLHWKCQSCPFAHHLSQLVYTCGLAVEPPPSQSAERSSSNADIDEAPEPVTRKYSGLSGFRKAARVVMLVSGNAGDTV
jgi:hypothetical protein